MLFKKYRKYKLVVIGLQFLVLMTCCLLCSNCDSSLKSVKDKKEWVQPVMYVFKEKNVTDYTIKQYNLNKECSGKKREVLKNVKKYIKKLKNRSTFESTCTPFFITRVPHTSKNSMLKYPGKPPAKILADNRSTSQESLLAKEAEVKSYENKRGRFKNFFLPKTSTSTLPDFLNGHNTDTEEYEFVKALKNASKGVWTDFKLDQNTSSNAVTQVTTISACKEQSSLYSIKLSTLSNNVYELANTNLTKTWQRPILFKEKWMKSSKNYGELISIGKKVEDVMVLQNTSLSHLLNTSSYNRNIQDNESNKLKSTKSFLKNVLKQNGYKSKSFKIPITDKMKTEINKTNSSFSDHQNHCVILEKQTPHSFNKPWPTKTFENPVIASFRNVTSRVSVFSPFTKLQFRDLFNFQGKAYETTHNTHTKYGFKSLSQNNCKTTTEMIYQDKGITSIMRTEEHFMDDNEKSSNLKTHKSYPLKYPNVRLTKFARVFPSVTNPYKKLLNSTSLYATPKVEDKEESTFKNLAGFKSMLSRNRPFRVLSSSSKEILEPSSFSTDSFVTEDNHTSSTNLREFANSSCMSASGHPKNTIFKHIFSFNKQSPLVNTTNNRIVTVSFPSGYLSNYSNNRNTFFSTLSKESYTEGFTACLETVKSNKKASTTHKKSKTSTTDWKGVDSVTKRSTDHSPNLTQNIHFESQVLPTTLVSESIVDMNPEVFFNELDDKTEAENVSSTEYKNFLSKYKFKSKKQESVEKATSFKSKVNVTEILECSSTPFQKQSLNFSDVTTFLLYTTVSYLGMPNKLTTKRNYHTTSNHYLKKSNSTKSSNLEVVRKSSKPNTTYIHSPFTSKEIESETSKTYQTQSKPITFVESQSTDKSFNLKSLFFFRKPTSDNTNLSYNFDPGGLSSSSPKLETESTSPDLNEQTEKMYVPCYCERCEELDQSFQSDSCFTMTTDTTLKSSMNHWKFWKPPLTTSTFSMPVFFKSRTTHRPIVETEEGNLFMWHEKHFEEDNNFEIATSTFPKSNFSGVITNMELPEITYSTEKKKSYKNLFNHKNPPKTSNTSASTTKMIYASESDKYSSSSLQPSTFLKSHYITAKYENKNKIFSQKVTNKGNSSVIAKHIYKSDKLNNFTNATKTKLFSSLNIFKFDKSKKLNESGTNYTDFNYNKSMNNFDAKNLSYFIQNLTHLPNSTVMKNQSYQMVMNETGGVNPLINKTDSNNTVNGTSSANNNSFSIMAYVLKPFESLISVFKGDTPQNMTKLGDVNSSSPFHNGSIPSHLRPQNSSLVILALNNANKSAESIQNLKNTSLVNLALNDSSNSTKDGHEPKMIGLFDVLGGWFHCMVENYVEPKPQDIHFFLFTRKNPEDPEELFLAKEVAEVEDNSTDIPTPVLESESSSEKIRKKRVLDDDDSDFDPLNFATSQLESKWFNIHQETKVLVHGYIQDAQTDVIVKMKDAYLKKGNFNVIVVDWSIIGDNTCYPAVAEHGPRSVGRLLARLLDQLVEGGVSLAKLHVVGFSLGAHVAGRAGTEIQHGLVSRITGLDPALPYVPMEPDVSLDSGDAVFVDVIHSAAGYLGQPGPMGNVDFYPNGGSQQPGCDLASLGACSHRRSAMYFIESVTSQVGFKAMQCESWHDFQTSRCNNSLTLLMGEPCPTNASGKYFLNTGNKEPFALLSDDHNKVKKSLLLDVFYEMP